MQSIINHIINRIKFNLRIRSCDQGFLSNLKIKSDIQNW